MSVPTVSWSEGTPSGTDKIREGDDRIQELKTQIREVVDVDHDFPSSGQAADVGQHKQVTLQEQADLGTGAANATILGSQTASGKGELIYVDEDDNDVQMTDGGVLAALKVIYPVGGIYISTLSTNPNTLLGFGTWTAFGAGRTLVGLNSGDGDFDTSEETGGSKTHTLTVNEMPAHTHGYSAVNNENTAASQDQSGGRYPRSKTTSSTGGGAAHSIVQPYIVVYMWKRTV